MKHKIIHFESINSTNTYIKEHYQDLDEFTIVMADLQTQGKGRMDRVWKSNKGENLMFSMLLKPNIDSSKLPLISMVVGASMQQALSKYIPCYIKWPNDIIINDKKVCGILVEGVYSDKLEAIIPGVGVNVNQQEFSDDLIMKASSLGKETNTKYDINDILKDYLANFDYLYNDFLLGNNQFIKICKEYNYLKGKTVYYGNKPVIVLDIMDNGNLLVDDNGKRIELFFGEVTLKNIYNKKIK